MSGFGLRLWGFFPALSVTSTVASPAGGRGGEKGLGFRVWGKGP